MAEDPIDAAAYYFRIANATKQEYKYLQRQHAKTSNIEQSEQNLNSKLEDLEAEKAELAAQIAKSGKGTRLVICLQNSVRKMLSDKLEEKAA